MGQAGENVAQGGLNCARRCRDGEQARNGAIYAGSWLGQLAMVVGGEWSDSKVSLGNELLVLDAVTPEDVVSLGS